METPPLQQMTAITESRENRKQREIDEWTGRNAPEHGAGTLRRRYVRNATQGPQHDLIRGTANLLAGERVAEFMHQDDQKKRHVFNHVPDRGTVTAEMKKFDTKQGNYKPGPMEVNIDSQQSEYAK